MPGVSFRSAAATPILYINNPPGVPTEVRRKTLDGLRALNEMSFRQVGRSRKRNTRIQQYELAFAWQASVPEIDRHVAGTRPRRQALYGDDVKKPGFFSPIRCCLPPPFCVETGRPFRPDLSHNWDQRNANRPRAVCPDQCSRRSIAPVYGLVARPQKNAGMLDETFDYLGAGRIWVAPFISQGGADEAELRKRSTIPRCFPPWWMAGGRPSRPGTDFLGETDDFSYKHRSKIPCTFQRFFHATVLHLFGFRPLTLYLSIPGTSISG